MSYVSLKENIIRSIEIELCVCVFGSFFVCLLFFLHLKLYI